METGRIVMTRQKMKGSKEMGVLVYPFFTEISWSTTTFYFYLEYEISKNIKLKF